MSGLQVLPSMSIYNRTISELQPLQHSHWIASIEDGKIVRAHTCVRTCTHNRKLFKIFIDPVTYVHVCSMQCWTNIHVQLTCISSCKVIFLVIVWSSIMKNRSSVSSNAFLKASVVFSPLVPMSDRRRMLGMCFWEKSQALEPQCPSSTMYIWMLGMVLYVQVKYLCYVLCVFVYLLPL